MPVFGQPGALRCSRETCPLMQLAYGEVTSEVYLEHRPRGGVKGASNGRRPASADAPSCDPRDRAVCLRPEEAAGAGKGSGRGNSGLQERDERLPETLGATPRAAQVRLT